MTGVTLMLIRLRSPTGQFRLDLQETDTFKTLINEIAKLLKSDRKFKLLLQYRETEILKSKLK